MKDKEIERKLHKNKNIFFYRKIIFFPLMFIGIEKLMLSKENQMEIEKLFERKKWLQMKENTMCTDEEAGNFALDFEHH